LRFESLYRLTGAAQATAVKTGEFGSGR